jgi:hypothetical protein
MADTAASVVGTKKAIETAEINSNTANKSVIIFLFIFSFPYFLERKLFTLPVACFRISLIYVTCINNFCKVSSLQYATRHVISALAFVSLN